MIAMSVWEESVAIRRDPGRAWEVGILAGKERCSMVCQVD